MDSRLSMDRRTRAKLYQEGLKVAKGDRMAGIWIVPATRWYEVGRSHVYLHKGSRLKASWCFDGDDWDLCVVNTDATAPPKEAEGRQRLWKWYVIVVVVLMAILFLMRF